MTHKHTTYERVQLFSGGGSRFAIELPEIERQTPSRSDADTPKVPRP